MGTTRRLTRRDLKQKDQVLTGLEQAVSYAQTNRRRMLFGAGLVVAVFIVGLGVYAVMQKRARDANQALGGAIDLLRRPVGESEDGQESFSSLEAKYVAVRDKSKELMESYSGTGVARVARFLHASSQAQLGDTQTAAAIFQELGDESPGDPVAAFAAIEHAEALVAGKDEAAAVASYQRLANSDSPYVPKDHVLLRLGELLEAQDDRRGALEAYQRLVTEMPDSPQFGKAQAKVTELGAALGGAASGGEVAVPTPAAENAPPFP